MGFLHGCWHEYGFVLLDDAGYAPAPSPDYRSDSPLYDMMAEGRLPSLISLGNSPLSRFNLRFSAHSSLKETRPCSTTLQRMR